MADEPDSELLKRRLRSEILARRAARSVAERAAAAAALAERVCDLPEMAAAGTVACYVSTLDEPGTDVLLERLTARSCVVLLPVLLPNLDLDWAAYEPGALRVGRYGLREPVGPRLGSAAVAGADVVICPGLVGDLRGHRLGRGGGSYDRALARVPSGVLRVLLLYDDEVLVDVPAELHDERVHVIVTPTRTLRLAT